MSVSIKTPWGCERTYSHAQAVIDENQPGYVRDPKYKQYTHKEIADMVKEIVRD